MKKYVYIEIERKYIKDRMKNYIKIALASLAIVAVALLGVVLYSAFNGVFKISKSDITLIINEYQLKNENTIKNSQWESPDWIELYNYGDEDIWLGDKYLSDDSVNLLKCQLPDKVIEAGGYLIVYASSLCGEIDGEVHVAFKLSEDDGEIFLSSSEEIIDSRRIDALGADISAGYNLDGKWMYFATPTPGSANITQDSKNLDIQPVYKEMLPIVINEYMSSNTYTIKDEFNESSDWIELYNPNDTAINLNDYYISDEVFNQGKYRMPHYILEPYEYVLVYASGQEAQSENCIHVPFSLGQGDLNVVVSSYTGIVVNMCTLDPLPTDISAGLNADGNWVYFHVATPNEANSENTSLDYNIAPERVSYSPIVINEVMPNNKYGLLDADGDSSDWIELYNPADYDISLDGYALSDNTMELDKWMFPADTIIKAKEYLIVFLSDKDKTEDSQLHASFALGNCDEVIMLVDEKGAIASSIDLEDMPGNVSKGRVDDGFGYFPLPTPDGENSGSYVEELKADEAFLLTDIYISEVAAGQATYSQYGDAPLREYIELYNAGQEAINLSGYLIADEDNVPWEFPDVFIQPDGYITLQLKGNAAETHSIINADLSISSNGEQIMLWNSQGTIIDCYNTGYLTSGISSGRVYGMGSSRYFFAEKTPNKDNSTEILQSYCAVPEFMIDGGMIAEDSIYLEMACQEGEEIRYTLDGREPTQSSYQYTEPIFLSEDTVVKAACYAEGKLSSAVIARTYIFEREHDLPIVCLSTSPVYLFGNSCGILAEGDGYVESEPPHFGANYWNNWECEISFEYYDIDNQLGLSFEAGLQVAGQYSRSYDQKSLVVRLRDEYGLDEVYYPFFEDCDVDEFSHILLRTSGQDWGGTKIKDYFIHQSVKGYTDVDIMDGTPVAVYLNGEYWGLYNLREKQNEDYIADHYDVDEDDVTIIKSGNIVLEGDGEEWHSLLNFIEDNDFSDDTAYAKLCEMIDIQAFTDYAIIQSFYGNYDIGNIKYWKYNGGKWRPMLYDTDMALVAETSHINYLEAYFKESEYTVFFNAMYQNQGFREDFVERYAYFLNEVFTEENLIGKIEELSGQIENEIVYQIERFRAPFTYERWQDNIAEMKELVLIRRDLSVEHIQEYFNLSDGEMDKMFP